MPPSKRGHPPRRSKVTRPVAAAHHAAGSDRLAIAECCSEIAEATSIALELQLNRLRALLSKHFQHEEILLEQAGSALYGYNARDHALFLELCDKAIQANRAGSKDSRQLILRELLPALHQHIAFRDQLIALHLNSVDPESRSSPRANR